MPVKYSSLFVEKFDSLPEVIQRKIYKAVDLLDFNFR